MTQPDESAQLPPPVPCPHGIQPNRLRQHDYYINGVAYKLCEACFRRVVSESDQALQRARREAQRQRETA